VHGSGLDPSGRVPPLYSSIAQVPFRPSVAVSFQHLRLYLRGLIQPGGTARSFVLCDSVLRQALVDRLVVVANGGPDPEKNEDDRLIFLLSVANTDSAGAFLRRLLPGLSDEQYACRLEVISRRLKALRRSPYEHFAADLAALPSFCFKR
jgi:hypothetical protein